LFLHAKWLNLNKGQQRNRSHWGDPAQQHTAARIDRKSRDPCLATEIPASNDARTVQYEVDAKILAHMFYFSQTILALPTLQLR
jgi:hypothetical protein